MGENTPHPTRALFTQLRDSISVCHSLMCSPFSLFHGEGWGWRNKTQASHWKGLEHAGKTLPPELHKRVEEAGLMPEGVIRAAGPSREVWWWSLRANILPIQRQTTLEVCEEHQVKGGSYRGASWFSKNLSYELKWTYRNTHTQNTVNASVNSPREHPSSSEK